MGGLRTGVVKIPGSQRRKPGPRLGSLHLVAETSQEVVAGRDANIEMIIWMMIKEGVRGEDVDSAKTSEHASCTL